LIPIRFGTPTRELSGLYQPATVRAERTGCIVLCNPFGQEAIRSHRMYRILADRLSRNGQDVLRFDYYGTGDSAGDDGEGDIDGWIDDVLRADDEVIRRSGCVRCSWFGLRLGASLAALASGRRARPPNRLVLWEPVIDGPGYLADLASAHIAAAKEEYDSRWIVDSRLRDAVLAESEAEALGFPLPHTLKKQLFGMSPSSFKAARAGRIALVCERITNNVSHLKQHLDANGNDVSAMEVQTGIDWATNEALNSAVVPFEALQTITAAILENR
jgi:pimeloyl-ACP methyl ester carboxylesterase